MMVSGVQKRIIKDLLSLNKTNFNELWGKNESSNLFAYHLKKLVDKGLVVKSGDDYELSPSGKILAFKFSSRNQDFLEQPLVVVQLLIRNNGKVLVEKRFKHPFKGFYGFVSSKIPSGVSFEDFARDLFFEKFSVKVDDWVLKGFEKLLTFDGEKLIHDAIVFTLESENVPEPNLGDGMKWVGVSNYNSEKIIPCPWINRIVGDEFFFVKAVRRIGGGGIVCDLLSALPEN